MFDSKGLITKSRDVNKYKAKFSQSTEMSLTEALSGADVFIGVSKADLLEKEMLLGMASNPIVFAMANPNPEIKYELAKQTRSDIIMATGRSDYPNQVNNVLGFPFIFRGALDVRARVINSEMKLAAVNALAELAREDVPKEVFDAYGSEFSFGSEYIIPKPFDPRVLSHVAYAVAKAAMESGVAREKIDLVGYRKKLEEMSLRLAEGKF